MAFHSPIDNVRSLYIIGLKNSDEINIPHVLPYSGISQKGRVHVMVFYKLKFFGRYESDHPEDCEENRIRNSHLSREDRADISSVTDDFNAHRTDSCFITDIKEEKIIVCLACEKRVDMDLVRTFLKEAGFRVEEKMPETEEITFQEARHMARRAESHYWIDDSSELFWMAEYEIHSMCVQEEVVTDSLISSTESDFYTSSSLSEELQRISEQGKQEYFYGHPVHYLISTDNEEFCRRACYMLVRALREAGRLYSSRVAVLSTRRWRFLQPKQVFQNLDGGSVLACATSDELRDQDLAGAEMRTLDAVTKAADRYRNQTLLFMMVPPAKEKFKKEVFERLPGWSFVEIRDDPISEEKALEVLEKIADDRHMQADSDLRQMMRDENLETYSSGDLTRIFARWSTQYLKKKIYPQYAKIGQTDEFLVKETEKGNAYDELQKMIGLSEPKRLLDKALASYRQQKLLESRGIKLDRPAMHMVFTGNPGTAKTTVARLFGKILKEEGILSNGHLIETGRSDLVGQYVGWTAHQVHEKFRMADGGILFIDEAYSLVDDRRGLYGDEAINTIVQDMENYRESLIVILAGYTKEMENFLTINPGLRSRIAFHVQFPDYTPDELVEITDLTARKKSFALSDGAREKVRRICQLAVCEPDFGNGRYVRNMVENAIMNQGVRVLKDDYQKMSRKELTTLNAEDFEEPARNTQPKKVIGFH